MVFNVFVCQWVGGITHEVTNQCKMIWLKKCWDKLAKNIRAVTEIGLTHSAYGIVSRKLGLNICLDIVHKTTDLLILMPD